MALELVGLKAVAENSSEAISEKFRQVLILSITGDAADVALDLRDPAATFNTDNALRKKLVKAIRDLEVAADRLVSVSGDELLLRSKVATGAATASGSYKIAAITKSIPSIAFHTGEGPTAYDIRLEWDLKVDQTPILTK